MKTKKVTIPSSLAGAACTGAILLIVSGASAQNLFVTSYSTDDVLEITPAGVQSVFATGMNYPVGLAFNSAGDLFVANSANNVAGAGNITEITPSGKSVFASGIAPQGLAMNNSGDLFDADYRSGNIYEFTPNGVQSTFAKGLSLPSSLAFNAAGDLFVAGGGGSGTGYITEFTPGGVSSPFASGLNSPAGLAFNNAGILFESDQNTGNVYDYSPSGSRSTFASGLNSPNDLAFNSAGNLFVGVSNGNGSGGYIAEFTPGGAPSTFASGIVEPNGLAFQPVPEPTGYSLIGVGALIFLACLRARKVTLIKA